MTNSSEIQCIDSIESSVERVDRTIAIQAGTYWECITPVNDSEIGDLQLLYEVKAVDGTPHTVKLLKHPKHWGGHSYCYQEYLINEFLAHFIPHDNPDAVRQGEINQLHDAINRLQNEMQTLQLDPPGITSPAPAVTDQSTEVSPASVSLNTSIQSLVHQNPHHMKKQMTLQKHRIEKHAQALMKTSEAIATQMKQLTPYYKEKGLCAEASLKSSQHYLKQLNQGLETLDLYTGESVQVMSFQKGMGADPAEKVVIRQRLLYMDEESLIHSKYGGADFENLNDFGKALCDDRDLLIRVLPESRCIVAMQFRRYPKDYGNQDPLDAVIKTDVNKKAFLLIRNGENIHAIFSSIEYMNRLFPSQNEIAKPFTGYHGETITIDDIRFADARSKSEQIILHYKRLLILLWGLYDHHETIIGQFKAEEKHGHLNLLAATVQEMCFQFLMDEENLLGENRPSFNEWVNEQNAKIQQGSEILCYWRHLIKEDNTPGIYNTHGDKVRRPVNESDVKIVQVSDGLLCVRVTTKAIYSSSDKQKYNKVLLPIEFNIKNDPSNTIRNCFYSGQYFGLLCLDAVTTDDIDYYLNNRESRRDYLDYIDLFMAARLVAKRNEEETQCVKVALLEAVYDANLSTPDKQSRIQPLIDDAVRLYRASHRAQPFPPVAGSKPYAKMYRILLDMVWSILGHRTHVVDWVKATFTNLDTLPLKLVINGNNIIKLYTTTPETERVLTYGEHIWVDKHTLKVNKTNCAIKTTTPVSYLNRPDEYTLYQWEENEQTLPKDPIACSINSALKLQKRMDGDSKLLRHQLTSAYDNEIKDEMDRIVSYATSRHKKYVRLPQRQFIIGLVKKQTSEHRYAIHMIVLQGCRLDALYHRANDSQRKLIERRTARMYQSPDRVLLDLKKVNPAFRQSLAISMSHASGSMTEGDYLETTYLEDIGKGKVSSIQQRIEAQSNGKGKYPQYQVIQLADSALLKALDAAKMIEQIK